MAGVAVSFPLPRGRMRWRGEQPPMLLLIPLICYDEPCEGGFIALSLGVDRQWPDMIPHPLRLLAFGRTSVRRARAPAL